MDAPENELHLTLFDAATRQTNAAIAAFEQGLFDVAMTLAGAAEGMIKRDGPHMFQWLRDQPRALAEFGPKDWITILNLERDWLKHGGAPTMTITRSAAAYMIARSMTKLDTWSPKMEDFKVWLLANFEEF